MEWVQKKFMELGERESASADSLRKEGILRVRNVMLLDYKGLTEASARNSRKLKAKNLEFEGRYF